MNNFFLQKLGVEFTGEVEGCFYFNDLETGSTLMLRVDGFTHDQLISHVELCRERFANAAV